MHIPVYQQIEFENWDEQSLRETLKASSIGLVPCYSFLPEEQSQIECEQLIEVLSDILKSLHIHPRTPYPYYLISQYNHQHELIPTLNAKKELPHFFMSSKRNPSAKENDLVNRVNILGQKIRGIPLYQRNSLLKSYALDAKELHNQVKIAHFYDQLEQII